MAKSGKRGTSIRPAIKAGAAALLVAGIPASAAASAGAGQPLYAGRLDPFRGKTLEEKVRELADREEIRELIAAYAHRVAHGLSIADLFTDDGAYIHRRSGKVLRQVHGRAALDAYFRDRPGEAGNSLPMIHNYIFSISGDEASGICSNELRIVENGTSIIASGYYRDRFRRVGGRWRFVERDVDFFHWVPVQEGWAKPAAAE